jgi:DNA-binding FadR family transcriptional regulator
MLDSLSDVMLQVRLQAMPLPGDLDRGFVEHQAIIDAIGARDPAAARHEMAHHLEGALRAFHASDRILRGVPAHGLRASAGEAPVDLGSGGGDPG